jgi:hypothetical protein
VDDSRCAWIVGVYSSPERLLDDVEVGYGKKDQPRIFSRFGREQRRSHQIARKAGKSRAARGCNLRLWRLDSATESYLQFVLGVLKGDLPDPLVFASLSLSFSSTSLWGAGLNNAKSQLILFE